MTRVHARGGAVVPACYATVVGSVWGEMRYASAARDFFHRHPKAAGLLFGLAALLVCGALLVVWEMGYECTSTRVNVT